MNYTSGKIKAFRIKSAVLIYLFMFSSSPDMPENEATFAISAGGVTDAKE